MAIRLGQPKDTDNMKRYAAIIEKILSAIDINPYESRVDPKAVMSTQKPTDPTKTEHYVWRFSWGSAMVAVDVIERNGVGFFQVFSPLGHVENADDAALFRYLLERNMDMTSAAFALMDNVVYVFSERALEGMNAIEAQAIITLVALYADDQDHRLVDNFGLKPYTTSD